MRINIWYTTKVHFKAADTTRKRKQMNKVNDILDCLFLWRTVINPTKNELPNKTESSLMLIYSWFHTWGLSERVVTSFEWGQLYLDFHYNSNLLHKSDVAPGRHSFLPGNQDDITVALFSIWVQPGLLCSPAHWSITYHHCIHLWCESQTSWQVWGMRPQLHASEPFTHVS